MAEIESNESLKTYTIRSPITGRVVQRHANTGEVTQDQVLFSIANFDTVWAELRVYPAQQSSVSEGQAVHLLTGSGSVASTVDHILPSIESPYQLARVKLANDKQSLFTGIGMTLDNTPRNGRTDGVGFQAFVRLNFSQNSYLIKADIEKSEAEHEH